jgi:hypothetical protein
MKARRQGEEEGGMTEGDVRQMIWGTLGQRWSGTGGGQGAASDWPQTRSVRQTACHINQDPPQTRHYPSFPPTLPIPPYSALSLCQSQHKFSGHSTKNHTSPLPLRIPLARNIAATWLPHGRVPTSLAPSSSTRALPRALRRLSSAKTSSIPSIGALASQHGCLARPSRRARILLRRRPSAALASSVPRDRLLPAPKQRLLPGPISRSAAARHSVLDGAGPANASHDRRGAAHKGRASDQAQAVERRQETHKDIPQHARATGPGRPAQPAADARHGAARHAGAGAAAAPRPFLRVQALREGGGGGGEGAAAGGEARSEQGQDGCAAYVTPSFSSTLFFRALTLSSSGEMRARARAPVRSRLVGLALLSHIRLTTRVCPTAVQAAAAYISGSRRRPAK